MNPPNAQLEQYKSRLREALNIINALKSRLDAVEAIVDAPIAVVGYGCRFPGGEQGPEDFWQALDGGVDAVQEIPADRWPANAIAGSHPEVRWAALLNDVSLFDAAFFSISPREAESLDPQQRMLLEVAWEALEHAGQRIDGPIASRTGVFVGICSADYAQLVANVRSGDLDAYCGTGNTLSAAAGRVSFALGFQGPAMSIDTACSSSLTAISEACQALRARTCDMALAGGVNAILSAHTMALLAQTQALSPDGRCKSFDARANGFVRGEGCGLVVLKRLADAIENGDRICGIIRSWVVNQDGRSTGLTTPNVLSQQVMLREALARARLTPSDIGYVETHGTGTSLGDPIEAEALREVLGAPRADKSTCVLGTVKTNLGHLEGAAGAAGIIKVLLSFQHERIPKNLHFKHLNPRISFDGTPFVIPTENVPWPRSSKPRHAGVSSFGISGTNSHIILEEPPEQEQTRTHVTASAYLLPLSAKTPKALMDLAQSYVDWLPTTNAAIHDIVYTASARREHHDHRIALVGQSREEFAALLSWVARGEMPVSVASNQSGSQGRPKIVFVFPGQGSQWIGMGKHLLVEEPAFRAVLEVCDSLIQQESGFSILAELEADETRSRLGEIDVVQPLLFAIEIALAAVWRSWGVEPDCVVGHSMGEVAAAHVAGMLNLHDAVKVICRRSRLLRRISGQGGMALVELPMAEAERAIAGHSTKLGVAVSNGPRSTVLSGDPTTLEEVVTTLEKRGVFCRRVKVDVASHSPQVDPLRSDLLDALYDVRPTLGNGSMRSTVTGNALRGTELVASYWADNLREPVRFLQVAQELMREGHRVFIEMSPHPILLPSIEENLRETHTAGAAIASMRRQAHERRTILEALGTLFMHGVPIHWEKLHPMRGRVVTLPSYAWQRERYWVTANGKKQRTSPTTGHPLLGTPFVTSTHPNTQFWKRALSIDDAAFLADHRVGGKVLLPGAAYIEIALAAARERLGEGSIIIEDLAFLAPLVLDEESSTHIEVSLSPTSEPFWTFRLSTMTPSEKAMPTEAATWTLHAEARIRLTGNDQSTAKQSTLLQIQERCRKIFSVDEFFRRESQMGFEMGPAFRGLTAMQREDQEVLGRIELPDDIAPQQSSYLVHPALLDTALRAAAVVIPGNSAVAPRLLTHIRKLAFEHGPGATVWSHARVDKEVDAQHPIVTLYDDDGRPAISIEGFETRVAAMLRSVGESRPDVFIGQTWESAELPAAAREQPRGRWLVLSDDSGVGERIRDRLMARGHEVTCVWARKKGNLPPRNREIDPSISNELRALIAEAIRHPIPLTGIVHCFGIPHSQLPNPSPAEVDAAWQSGCASTLYVAQALTRMAVRNMPRLWLVCRNAQFVADEPAPVDASQSPLWALGRMISLEYPEVKCSRIDIDFSESSVDAIARELVLRDNKEDEIVLRGMRRFVGRLRRLQPPTLPKPMPFMDAEATYLITGGLGGMGLLGARWLASAGAKHLVLMDIEPVHEVVQEALAELESMGVSVVVSPGDVTNQAQVSTMIDELDRGPHPLKGILHCAARIDVRSLSNQTMDQLRNDIAPRMLGGWILHCETLHRNIDFLVFFSSIYALIGAPSLGGDVMGNAFLNGLAYYRRNLGLPATIIDWGPFDGMGMDERLSGSFRKARHGMDGLAVDDGAALFMRTLRDDWVHMGIAALDFRGWLESHPQATASLRFGPLASPPPAAPQKVASGEQTGFLDKLKHTPAAAREDLLENFLRQHLASILRMDPARIDRLAPLRALGIDSLMSLELRNRLEAALSLRLSATLVWSHPTIAAMGRHITEMLGIANTTPLETPISRLDAGLTLLPEELDTGSLEATAEDDELFKSFDLSIQRMRSRRNS